MEAIFYNEYAFRERDFIYFLNKLAVNGMLSLEDYRRLFNYGMLHEKLRIGKRKVKMQKTKVDFILKGNFKNEVEEIEDKLCNFLEVLSPGEYISPDTYALLELISSIFNIRTDRLNELLELWGKHW